MARGSKLGDLERAVMEALWDAGKDWLTVREVHATVAGARDVAYTTVMTVLDRMTRKKLVEQQREGRAYRYRPMLSRGAMTAELMREALGEFAAADRKAALVAFVGEATAADRRALSEALAELDRRR